MVRGAVGSEREVQDQWRPVVGEKGKLTDRDQSQPIFLL